MAKQPQAQNGLESGESDTDFTTAGGTPGEHRSRHWPPGWSAGQPVQFPIPFGKYRIERKIGQGGMGAVYLATDTSLSRLIALKIPNASLYDNPTLRERFLREGRLAATLQHPNICTVFDVGRQDGIDYLAMTYVEGRALSSYIRPGQKLPARNVLTVIKCLAMAMADAHQKGVIHRDIKPSNIMIGPNKQPMLMDFGLARRMESAEGSAVLTRDGAILGTPEYMSPEQIDGDLERIGPRSDIYSLGVVLYELLAGEKPFQGPLSQLITQIATLPPPPLRRYRPDLGPTVEAICQRALAKQPEERFPDMRAFANAIRDCLAGKVHETAPAVPAADESVVIELFDAMAKQVQTGRPGQRAGGTSGVYSPVPDVAPLQATGMQPLTAGGGRPHRLIWPWVLSFAGILMVGLALIGWVLQKNSGSLVRAREEARIAQVVEQIKKNPTVRTALEEADRLEPLLANHPRRAKELGLLIARSYDFDRAVRFWRYADEGSHRRTYWGSEPSVEGELTQARAWEDIGLGEAGETKARFLWKALGHYKRAERIGDEQPVSYERLMHYLPRTSGVEATEFVVRGERSSTPLRHDSALVAIYENELTSNDWTMTLLANDSPSLTVTQTGRRLVVQIPQQPDRTFALLGADQAMIRLWMVVSPAGVELYDGENCFIPDWPVIPWAGVARPTHARFTSAKPLTVRIFPLQNYTSLVERLAAKR